MPYFELDIDADRYIGHFANDQDSLDLLWHESLPPDSPENYTQYRLLNGTWQYDPIEAAPVMPTPLQFLRTSFTTEERRTIIPCL